MNFLHLKKLGLAALLISLPIAACSPKPARVTAAKSIGASDANTNPNVPNPLGENPSNGGTDPAGNDPDKSSFTLFESGMTLGLKKLSSCEGPDISGIGALSSYIYFEVVKDTSDLNISFEGACSKSLDKVVINILDSERKLIQKSTISGGMSTTNHTISNLKLKAGDYILAIEVPGTSESEIASFSVAKLKFNSTSEVRHTKTQDY